MIKPLTIGRWVDGEIVYEICPEAHHPHLAHICNDDFCGCDFTYLYCHVCTQNWPCPTKQEHLAARGKPFTFAHGFSHWIYNEKVCSTCSQKFPCDEKLRQSELKR